MNKNLEDYNLPKNSGHEAERTLRLVAELPPPEDLTDRVHQRLAVERESIAEREGAARRGFWSFWQPARRLQFAGAALLAIAVAGSTWSVYHSRNGAQAVTPVAPKPVAPQGTSGFTPAGAERKPSTLKPIKVPPAPKKKPGAGHVAKPSPKVLANQAAKTQADQ